MVYNPLKSLIQDHAFVEQVLICNKQFNKMEDAFLNENESKNGAILKGEFLISRASIQEKLMNGLIRYKSTYFNEIFRRINLPIDFVEIMAPIFETRRLKDRYVTAQIYEEASKLRDKEIELMKNEKVEPILREVNKQIFTKLNACNAPGEYFLSGTIFLIVLSNSLGSKEPEMLKNFELICTMWLITEVMLQIKVCNEKDYQDAMVLINFKKTEWETGLKVS